MAEHIENGMVELRQVLAWHLTSNHYPSLPLSLLDACVLAIKYMQEGEPDTNISLPEGILWRGQQTAPAWAVVDAHHLEAFVDLEDLGV
jgi:hypothetical protein